MTTQEIQVDVRLGVTLINTPDGQRLRIFHDDPRSVVIKIDSPTGSANDHPEAEVPDRPWMPLEQAVPMRDGKPIEIPDTEVWKNDLYTVHKTRFRWPGENAETGEAAPWVVHLSIRRNDRHWARDWRHFQRIKNELVGENCEAVELYPAEDRLVDTANQQHLWVIDQEKTSFMPGPHRKPLADRFWPRVDQSGGPDACWPWTGATNPLPRNYGRVARGGEGTGVSPFFTHRVAFALANGIHPDDIPKDIEVRHSCHNYPCCNPAHLSDGTSAQNKADSIKDGRMHFQNTERDDKGRFTPKVKEPADPDDPVEDFDVLDPRHDLWVIEEPGARWPVGWEDGRIVFSNDFMDLGARQRPHPAETNENVGPAEAKAMVLNYFASRGMELPDHLKEELS